MDDRSIHILIFLCLLSFLWSLYFIFGCYCIHTSNPPLIICGSNQAQCVINRRFRCQKQNLCSEGCSFSCDKNNSSRGYSIFQCTKYSLNFHCYLVKCVQKVFFFKKFSDAKTKTQGCQVICHVLLDVARERESMLTRDIYELRFSKRRFEVLILSLSLREVYWR